MRPCRSIKKLRKKKSILTKGEKSYKNIKSNEVRKHCTKKKKRSKKTKELEYFF